jgi:hypothetical protein
MKLTLPKLGTWSPPGLPKTQSLIVGVKTPRIWNVLGVIGKALKCRCPKWPRMSHLDICSRSYGQKKGRESNCQFDSRAQKVGNRPDSDVRWGSATWRWKALKESYKIGLDLVPIGGQGEKLWWPKVPGVPNQDSFGTPLWESRDKEPLGRGHGGVTQRILYGGRWWLPPSPGRGESSESKVARGLSQHRKGAEWVLINLWLVLDAGPCNKIIVPLPSLIPGLLARPSYPPF